MNHAETAILGEGLRQKGFQLVEFGQPTDLLVLNTCSVTKEAERTSRYLIRKTLKHSPQAFVAVTGCYAQTGADGLKHQAGIDLIVGHQFKAQWQLDYAAWKQRHLGNLEVVYVCADGLYVKAWSHVGL